MKTDTKRQKAKVGVAGNFINQMMANNDTLPEVGKGATILHYSDRSVVEVIKVSKDGKRVTLEDLDTIHDKTKEGGIGHQNWIHNPTGRFYDLVWKYGAWRTDSKQVVFTDEFYNSMHTLGFSTAGAYLKTTNKDLFERIYKGKTFPQEIVEGITKYQKTSQVVKILFGVKDYRYDWEF